MMVGAASSRDQKVGSASVPTLQEKKHEQRYHPAPIHGVLL
jgi:hypothetical protein